MGTTDGTPRANLDTLFETLMRKYGAYQVRTCVRDRDIINDDADYADYFDEAFGSGKAVSHEFDVLLATMGFIPQLKKIHREKSGSHDNQIKDTGSITDARDRTVTDTPVNTVTVTPTGNKVVTYQGTNSESNSGTTEGKLGAWDDNNYKGATYDALSNSGQGSENSTETTTNGEVTTTTHSGKAMDLVENDDNTRTLNTTKDDEGSFTETENTNLDWTVEDLNTLVATLTNFDLYNWIAREICYDSCYTEGAFYG